MNLVALLLSAHLQASPAGDRITYDQMVGCAATFRMASAAAGLAGDAELRQAGVTAAVAYDNLAYLYGEPLGILNTETEAAIRTDVDRQIALYGPGLNRRAPITLQAMDGDQRVCRALSERIAREAAEAVEAATPSD